jgi:WD40 repeat protein
MHGERKGTSILSLSFNATSTRLVSTSGEHSCKVWRCGGDVASSDGDDDESDARNVPVAELTLDASMGTTFNFRGAQFITMPSLEKSADGDDDGADGDEFLVAIVNKTSRGPSYLVVWDTQTWSEVRRIRVDTEALVHLEISHNRRLLAVATSTATLFVYELHSFALFSCTRDCHELPTTTLSFSPNDQTILSCSGDKSCRLIVMKKQSRCAGVQTSLFSSLLLAILVALVAFIAKAQLEVQPATQA